MSKPRFTTVVIDGVEGREYDLDYIMENPIPAKCKRCGFDWIDGKTEFIPRFMGWYGPPQGGKTVVLNDAIRAPSLEGCRCGVCGGELRPYEKGGPVTVEQVEARKQQPALF